jgi:hypothetical protein
MKQYPKFLYHRELEPVVVADPIEHEALGEGWAESPAAFEETPAEDDSRELGPDDVDADPPAVEKPKRSKGGKAK